MKTDAPKMVAVSQIRENEWNPNEVPAETMAQLKRNVERFGFNQPILVREIDGDDSAEHRYEVVDGAHRLAVALELGIDKIPVVVREFTDAEAKAQTIAMNKLRGEMDPERMAQILREIDGEGIEGVESLSEFIGFTGEELDALDALLAETPPPLPDTPAPDQRGDVKDGYFLVVTCKGETDQLKLLEKLEADGFECKVVVS